VGARVVSFLPSTLRKHRRRFLIRVLARLLLRRVGLEARLKSGHQPVGAWFSQLGTLHQVHHMWHYSSLEQRRATREKAWAIDTW
jgi:hypothetical protein